MHGSCLDGQPKLIPIKDKVPLFAEKEKSLDINEQVIQSNLSDLAFSFPIQ
jgi:hypothetical protein